jgi:hypothetical protein
MEPPALFQLDAGAAASAAFKVVVLLLGAKRPATC